MGISTYEVPMKYLEDIKVERKGDEEHTVFRLPFTWAGYGYIYTIWKEILGKTLLVHCSFGVLEIDDEYAERMFCDRFDYDDDECVISFRPM